MTFKHFTLTAMFSLSLLIPATVHAQDAGRMPASQRPAKNGELISTLEGSAAAYRSEGSLTQAFSGGPHENAGPCGKCRGWLVEAFLRWTDRLVTKLDPIGVVDSPFPAAGLDSGRLARANTAEWKPIPRLRPVQLHGGYGLVARITF